MKFLQFIFGVLLLVSFTACNIEKARPAKKQFLNIASDCLSAKDTALFRSFVSNSGIKVKILHFTADSLKRTLLEEGIDTEIDIVMLSSTYDLNQFEKSNLLQGMQQEEIPANIPKRYLSKTKKWAGIGIDPYVLVTLKDTSGKIRTYKDLTHQQKWCSTFNSNADWYPFYASIVQKMDPKKEYNAYDYIKQLKVNNLGVIFKKDSVSPCSILLTRYSTSRTNDIIKKSTFKNGKLIFPNQRIGGSFYNMYCFGIVKQARNYQNSLTFFEYLSNESVNKRLNNFWKTFPIVTNQESPYKYQNIRFKKYSITPLQLTSYYNRVKKILERLK